MAGQTHFTAVSEVGEPMYRGEEATEGIPQLSEMCGGHQRGVNMIGGAVIVVREVTSTRCCGRCDKGVSVEV